MVDTTKRNSLKALAAGATVAAVPGVVHAMTNTTTHSDIGSVVDHLRTHLAELGLHINVVPTPGHASLAIQVRNVSDSAVTLSHISPGLIRSGGDLYDVNSLLSDAGVHFAPGDTLRDVIGPMAQAA